MSSKSLFNTTLIKKDLKILSPILYINIIYLIFSYPFRYTQAIIQLKNTAFNFYSFENLKSSEIFIVGSFFSALIAFLCAIILFANEKNKKTIEILSVAPFSRKQIYINKIIAGLLVSIVPMIIIYMITYFIISTEPLLSSVLELQYFKFCIFICVLISLVIFSYFIMVSMLFGSVISTFICGSIFSFLPFGFLVLLDGLINVPDNLVDFSAKFTPVMAQVFSIIYSDTNIWSLLIYSIIFLLSGYFLFEMYKMEKNSEFLTFKWTEPVFKIGVFICSALLGANIMQVMLYDISRFETMNKILGLIIGGALGYFIPKAIISRSKVA
ncbi:ABC transporter permease subunit [Peptoanaerobacter stomatis]|uniref:ABC transporter permease subunit n=1 Tax=Peptoanaerobacter stomatis TaxID=796937 RepID=UPI003FA032AC